MCISNCLHLLILCIMLLLDKKKSTSYSVQVHEQHSFLRGKFPERGCSCTALPRPIMDVEVASKHGICPKGGLVSRFSKILMS